MDYSGFTCDTSGDKDARNAYLIEEHSLSHKRIIKEVFRAVVPMTNDNLGSDLVEDKVHQKR